MAKYIALKKTDILRYNKEGKKDIFGDTASDVVGTLEIGQIFEVAKTGGGGRGIVMTPYLILPNGDYVIGKDAVLESEKNNANKTTPDVVRKEDGYQTPEEIAYNENADKLNKSKTKEPLFYVLVTIAVLTLGYFTYNKLKK